MLNIFAYYFSYVKTDHVAAISFIQESLEISNKLVEIGPTLRDMDYLVQTNFVSFYVLWRSKEYETCKKYISESKKYIYSMINEAE